MFIMLSGMIIMLSGMNKMFKFKFNILFPFFTFLSTIKYTEHFEIFECTTVEHFIIRQRQRRHIFRISRGIVRET